MKTTNEVTNRMNFEFDETKAKNNLLKHGVAFDLAARVFFDQNRIEIYDSREGYGEDRWVTIGFSGASLLYVVYTIRNEEVIRIISARKANEKDRKKYRQINA